MGSLATEEQQLEIVGDTYFFPGEHTPGFLSQMDLDLLMQNREVAVNEVRHYEEKRVTAMEELKEVDFEIEYKMESGLQPLGMKLLPPQDKKNPDFGCDIDIRQEFRSKEERARSIAKGKSLVDQKVTDVVHRLQMVNNNIQKSQNFKIIAMVNEMLRKTLKQSHAILTLSGKKPGPYPETNPLAFPGHKPVPHKYGRPGHGTEWKKKERLVQRKGKDIGKQDDVMVKVLAQAPKDLPSAEALDEMERVYRENIAKGEF